MAVLTKLCNAGEKNIQEATDLSNQANIRGQNTDFSY